MANSDKVSLVWFEPFKEEQLKDRPFLTPDEGKKDLGAKITTYQKTDDEVQQLPGKYGRAQGGCLLLARVGNDIAGCVGYRSQEEKDVKEVKRLYVLPKYRKLGIGNKMMLELMDVARLLDVRLLRLDSLERLPGALALYNKLGFYRIDAYIFNPFEDAVYLEYNLQKDTNS